ncbi:hypothetical protein OYT1_ch1884 [Ferriphaselus amnicola]|uniref:NERD domain-containing protein n=1 Tax=Ferriphaselus amnicola TaxID=1188319 RepID=A0A2Z6GCR1_9PROT|nr:nuclease-related domain-containing protein [Ferriphaselus amnicola]BBE51411.1 hypothetical protein OYT1_ch1884 [Ferriphaselus amnicola]
MLIKNADSRDRDLATLRSLLDHPAASADIKARVEQEIKKMQAGIKGEQDAAYEINFYFGPSKNWAVIHDLRVEHAGRVAQIDHLLINRFLECWVFESKHFSEGIAINEQGECTIFWNGKPRGIPSPYEQNVKHIAVLKAMGDSGAIPLPTRLGISIKPTYIGMVAVSKGARISRPKENGWWSTSVIKADQIRAAIDKAIDADNNILGAVKLVASDTLQVFARGFAARHRPILVDWHAKFGLSKVQPASPIIEVLPTVLKVEEPPAPKAEEQPSAKKSKLICKACEVSVTYNVAKFCWNNNRRFGGDIYCMNCQKTAPQPG